jgi:thiosulfate/3-mercaptopyruvate sulfurtransferase
MHAPNRAAPRLLALLAFCAGLAACGEAAPSPTAAPPPTPAPLTATATAVPSPTATAPPATRTGPAVSPIPEGTIAPAPESQVGGAILVSAADLKGMLNDPGLRLVDLGSAAEYAAGHAPGAIHIDWSELQVTDTSAPSIAAWQDQVAKLLGERGITAESRVVIYDHGTLYGARLWWVLDQLGQADKAILDGGFAAWQAAGGAASTTPAHPTPAVYAARPRPALLATEAQVRATLGGGAVALVDARSPAEYSGQNTSGAARGGHIPGAVNVPYADTAGAGGRFKSPADLRSLFAAQGVTPDRPVIAYCSTGVRAAVDYFALRLAGFGDARVYTGSWAEWGNDPSAPLAK